MHKDQARKRKQTK